LARFATTFISVVKSDSAEGDSAPVYKIQIRIVSASRFLFVCGRNAVVM
jgi:hypothetical protein